MPVIREYRPEEVHQVEVCFVELQDFLHRLEPNVLEGKAAKKYFGDIAYQNLVGRKSYYRRDD